MSQPVKASPSGNQQSAQKQFQKQEYLHKMYSRMGKATESQFTSLATNKQGEEEPSQFFNVSRILNPALRAQKPTRAQDRIDMIDAQKRFLDGDARTAFENMHQQSVVFTALANANEQTEGNNRQQRPRTTVGNSRTANGAIPRTSKGKAIYRHYFMSKERNPYTYVKPDEAPPIGHYRPKYKPIDAEPTQFAYASLERKHKINKQTRYKPQCLRQVKEGDYCTQDSRKVARETKSAEKSKEILVKQMITSMFVSMVDDKQREMDVKTKLGQNIQGIMHAAHEADEQKRMVMEKLKEGLAKRIGNKPSTPEGSGEQSPPGSPDKKQQSGANQSGDTNGLIDPKDDKSRFRAQSAHKIGGARQSHSSLLGSPIQGIDFDKMTNKEYPKNLYLGYATLRGMDPNEQRFTIIPNTNTCFKEAEKIPEKAAWKSSVQPKVMNFALKYYCQNGSYQPKEETIAPKPNVGHMKFKQYYGRTQLFTRDYVACQTGAAAHVAQLKTDHVDKKSKKLGHYKSGGGLVGMDKQKPRDNKMYYLSEKTNLKAMDKAIRHCKEGFELFDHKVLSSSQIKDRKKLMTKKNKSKDSLCKQFWSDLKIPINDRVARAHTNFNSTTSRGSSIKGRSSKPGTLSASIQYKKGAKWQGSPENKVATQPDFLEFDQSQETQTNSFSEFKEIQRKLNEAEVALNKSSAEIGMAAVALKETEEGLVNQVDQFNGLSPMRNNFAKTHY